MLIWFSLKQLILLINVLKYMNLISECSMRLKGFQASNEEVTGCGGSIDPIP